MDHLQSSLSGLVCSFQQDYFVAVLAHFSNAPLDFIVALQLLVPFLQYLSCLLGEPHSEKRSVRWRRSKAHRCLFFHCCWSP